MCTQSDSHSKLRTSHGAKRIHENGACWPQQVCELMKRGITRRKQISHAGKVQHNRRGGDYSSAFILEISDDISLSSWLLLACEGSVWLLDGSLTCYTGDASVTQVRRGSEIIKVLSLQDLWSFFFRCFRTQKYKNVFPIYELLNCLWNELLKKKT